MVSIKLGEVMVKRDLITNTIIGVLIVGIVILLRVFVFSTYQVKSLDENSYFKENEILLVHAKQEPKYKDFIVYEVNQQTYIGRVIASEGESVTYMDDIFYLNNSVESQAYIEKLKAAFLSDPSNESPYTQDFTLATISNQHDLTEIPKGKYLVLNDNRRNLKDSRQFGLIDKSQIKGVVTFKLFPLSQFGFLDVE